MAKTDLLGPPRAVVTAMTSWIAASHLIWRHFLPAGSPDEAPGSRRRGACTPVGVRGPGSRKTGGCRSRAGDAIPVPDLFGDVARLDGGSLCPGTVPDRPAAPGESCAYMYGDESNRGHGCRPPMRPIAGRTATRLRLPLHGCRQRDRRVFAGKNGRKTFAGQAAGCIFRSVAAHPVHCARKGGLSPGGRGRRGGRGGTGSRGTPCVYTVGHRRSR